MLFTTGYLTKQGVTDDGRVRLSIPNCEIKNLFIKKIREWFSDTTGIVIELKYAENGDMDAACSEALIKTGGSVII